MSRCPTCRSPVSPGTTFCRACGASLPESSTPAPASTLTPEIERQVKSLVDQGLKIEAVKLYRDHTGAGLKDAKEAVEDLQFGSAPPRDAAANADLEADALRLLREGEKIQAVRFYRDQTGTTLFDAKREVDAIAARHGITVEAGGFGGMVVVSIVALIAIAVVALAAILAS